MNNENLNKNKYYTFSEIVNAFRNGFVYNQELLKKLNNNIKVVNSNNVESKLYFLLKDRYEKEKVMSRLSLVVSKKSVSPITKFNNRYHLNEYKWMENNARYEFIDKDGELSFYYNNRLKYDKAFRPQVFIDNFADFSSNFESLRKTKLYELSGLYLEINPYQSLHVWNEGVFLENNDEIGREIIIGYNALKDEFYIRSNIRYSSYFIDKLLSTKIPKYQFPDEYNDYLIICKYLPDKLMIMDYIGRRKEDLEFTNKDDNVILTRKK